MAVIRFALRIKLFAALLLAVVLPGSALGSNLPGHIKDWQYLSNEVPFKSCLMRTESKSGNKGEVRILQGTQFYSSEYAFGILEIEPEDELEKRHQVKLQIDGRPYPTYVSKNLVLIEPAYKKSVFRAMVLGRTMKLTVTQPNKTLKEYKFSLQGFTAALEKISERCRIAIGQVVKGVAPPLGRGPSTMTLSVAPQSSKKVRLSFTAKARAVVEIIGEGSGGDLDLYVQDSEQRVLCKSNSYGDKEFCDWVAYSTEAVTVTIENRSDSANQFKLLSNKTKALDR